MITYNKMSAAEFEAEISAGEAAIAQNDALGRAATAERAWGRAMDLGADRRRLLARVTWAKAMLFKRQAAAR